MTCLLSFHSSFQTLVVLLGATCVTATLLRSDPSAAAKAELLQASTNETQRRPAMGIPFFSEDSARMAQMPLYPNTSQKRHVPGSPICEPRCFYTCGHSECDQSCEPVCLPPKCETLCTKSADKCETRCAKPKCAVVCPAGADCEGGYCPKCRSICAPPACTTSCSDSCHSVCAQPQCTWKCRLGNCPKPECKLKCDGLSPCRDFPQRNLTKLPRMNGMDIKSMGRASLDPTVLAVPPVPPPEGERIMPTSQPQSTLNMDVAPEFKTISPVKALKMEWEGSDMVEENARLLRR